MAEVINLTLAKIERICTAENNVREKLSRILEHMQLCDSERAVALNTAVYRVRHGGHPATAMNEALAYARRREDEHNRQRAGEWFRLQGDRFVPAWEPDGAA